MKTFQNLFAAGIFLIIISCSGRSDNKDTSTKSATQLFKNADCIFKYVDKYDQLLPLATIQKHFKGEMSKAEMKYQISKDPKGQVRDTYSYSWKSDRTKTVDFGGNKMTLPISNEIGLKWLGDDLFKIMDKESSSASFKAFYKTVTKEELNAAMDKAEQMVSTDKNIKEETKKSAMGIANGLAEGAKFEAIEGVGEAAAWIVKDNNLVVLVGDKTFKIIADVGKDIEANKKLAIALAQEVLKKCE